MPLKLREVEVTRELIDGFCCDRCKTEYDNDDWVETQEYMHWENVGGYGSIWGDGMKVEVTLCQKCTYDLFKDFAVLS